MALKPKHIVALIVFCLVLLTGTAFFIWKWKNPPIRTIDAITLYSAMSQCNKVQIIDFASDTVLYESSDQEILRWLKGSFVVDTNSPFSVLFSLDRYRLHFLNDDSLKVDLRLKDGMQMHWMHGSWDTHWDFYLTDASARQIVPWLCEKSEKMVYELFPDASLPPWAHRLPNPYANESDQSNLKLYWQ